MITADVIADQLLRIALSSAQAGAVHATSLIRMAASDVRAGPGGTPDITLNVRRRDLARILRQSHPSQSDVPWFEAAIAVLEPHLTVEQAVAEEQVLREARRALLARRRKTP